MGGRELQDSFRPDSLAQRISTCPAWIGYSGESPASVTIPGDVQKAASMFGYVCPPVTNGPLPAPKKICGGLSSSAVPLMMNDKSSPTAAGSLDCVTTPPTAVT